MKRSNAAVGRARDFVAQMPESGEFVPTPIGRIIYGKDSTLRLGAEIDSLKKSRVVVICSKSLSRADALVRVKDVLGNRCVGIFTETEAHVPRASAIRAANAIRAARADLTVTLGGSTCIDTARAAGILVANNKETSNDDADRAIFDRYRIRFTYPDKREAEEMAHPPLPFIAIPTTLSGGEFTFGLGMKNDATDEKEIFFDRGLAPRAVILDAGMTQWTPPELWTATGVKAIDHCVESIYSKRHMPLNDALCAHALMILTECLEPSVDDPTLRLQCQIGAWLAMYAVYPSVGPGIGHAIDHQLGARSGVPHGIAAAIMLPHAMAYNRAAGEPRFKLMVDALGLEPAGLSDAPAADCMIAFIKQFIAQLGLPQRLRDAGVAREDLSRIADDTWRDLVISTNPRIVGGAQEILALLEEAW